MKRSWFRVLIILLVAIIVIVYLASGFYSVNPNQQALVLRFGKLVRAAPDGLHYRIPWPVEKEMITSVHEEFTTSVGFRMREAQVGQAPLPFETEWLTGDRNLVDIQMVVNFFINDQEKHLFACGERPWFLIRWAAEAALTEILGQMTLDDVFADRNRVAITVKKRAQEFLDAYQAGVEITAVSPKSIDAPQSVWSAFDQTSRAKAEIDQRIREARKKEYTLLESARADARRTINQAEAEKEALVADARGRAQAFLALEEEYRQAPEGTRRRLVQETVREVFARVRVIQVGTESTLEIFVDQ